MPWRDFPVRFVAISQKLQRFGTVMHRIEAEENESHFTVQLRISLDLIPHRFEGIPSQGTALRVRALTIKERQERYLSCRVAGEQTREARSFPNDAKGNALDSI